MITLALLSMTLQQRHDPVSSFQGFGSAEQVGTAPSAHPMDGMYMVYWDEVLDGVAPNVARTVAPPTKTFDLTVKIRGGKFTGDAIVRSVSEAQVTPVSGHVFGAGKGGNLLTFWEMGTGYVRSFQVTLGLGKFAGTWHDTNGGSGDFLIQKYQ